MTLSAADRDEHRLTRKAGLVAAGTLLSRTLGLGRDVVIAGLFAPAIADAWNVAFAIPNVLRQVFAEGAVQAAVLPVLSRLREKEGDAAARRFFRELRGLSLCVLVASVLLAIAFAPQLVALFAPGYAGDPAQLKRTIALTRGIFPYVFFTGTAALSLAALNAHQRFVATSFSPALVNVAFIACAVILSPLIAASGADPVMSLAVGAVVGGLLQVISQWPSLRAIGYLEVPTLRIRSLAVREACSRMGPVVLNLGTYYLHVLLARRFLSGLGVGAQSYFGWALRLCDFPQGLLVMALQTATLPSLSRLAARAEHQELGRTFAFSMRLGLFLAIAASALLVGLAEPVVALLFQRGEFDALATRETAHALMAQGIGIGLLAGVRQLSSGYYALGDTRTPLLVSVLDLLVFALLARWLQTGLGHVGVGLAISVARALQMVTLWVILQRRMPAMPTKAILAAAARALGCGLLAAWAARAAAGLATSLGHGAVGVALPGLLGVLVFVAVFLGAARLARSEELATLVRTVRGSSRRVS